MGPGVRCHLYWFAEHLGRKAGYQHYCVDPWLSVAVNTTHSNLIFFFFFDTFHGTLILNLNKKVLQKKKNFFNHVSFLGWIMHSTKVGSQGEEELLSAPLFPLSTWLLLSLCTKAVLGDDKGHRHGCSRP